MYSELKKHNEKKKKRALRVRKTLKGCAEKPRLSVFKSNRNLFAQIINDETGMTLASISNIQKEIKGTELEKVTVKTAHELGHKLAEIAKHKNIHKVIFDRGPYRYHGILAAFADGARAKGLEF